MADQEKLSKLGDRAKEFVTKPGLKYAWQGQPVDLRTVDARTAEALANHPRCSFIQWADPKKRPEGQHDPLPVESKTSDAGSGGAGKGKDK